MSLRSHPDYPNFHLVEHPLVSHKLSLLRDQNTNKKLFKELVHEITLLLAYEATASLPLTSMPIDTPLESFDAPIIAGKKSVLLPILRAGLGMVDAFLSLMPGARVGHIGMYRDEKTLEPHTYFFKIPPSSSERIAFILDPMLATGGSTAAAISRLKQEGLKRMKLVCLLAAPEGVRHMSDQHPDVKIFSAALDRQLDENGYIRPGLGDAGNRLFGTR
jgi:uracil phosphoribosyltransferase